MIMTGLFDAPLIGGLGYRDDVLSEAEERALTARLDAFDLAPFRFGQWTGNRRTLSFGWRYDFTDASFAPADPIPHWLDPLRARAAAMADCAPHHFVHLLLARYDPGAGIGWHRDRDVFDRIVGFSLGAPAVLRFRRRRPGGFDRVNISVAPRSAYLLSGEARHEWEHRIVPGDALRFSITLRTLSDKGRRRADVQKLA